MLNAIAGEGGFRINLIHPQVGLFVFAWFLADLMTAAMIRLGHRIGALDRPHGHKIHREPVPFLGGVAIYLAFTIALFSLLRFESFEALRSIFAVILGAFFVVIVGIYDDFRPTSAVVRLVILFFATVAVSQFDVRITLTGHLYFDILLTLLWVAGVTSAVNSLDNMDGAATGVAAVAAFWTFYIAWYTPPLGQRAVTFVAVALLGSMIGFLRYNFRFGEPAKIFLGGNGSFLLGFLLATLMVLTGWSTEDKLKAAIIPCAVLVVPLYDITLATVLRIKNRVVTSIVGAIVYCGRDHLSHRLVALGLSRKQAVLVMYLFGIIGGAVAAFIHQPHITREVYLPIAGASGVALIVIGAVLDRARVYETAETANSQKD